MAQRPSASDITRAFADWLVDPSAPVREALGVLQKRLPNNSLLFGLYTPNDQSWSGWLSDHKSLASPTSLETEPGWHASDGQGSDCYFVTYVSPAPSGHLAALSLQSATQPDLKDDDRILLEMACPALAARYLSLSSTTPDPLALSEALDAMDDGFIVYDNNEKIVAFNNRHKELFPSFSEAIEIGATYESLLRQQQVNSELEVAKQGGEDWIRTKKEQLKIDRYQTEQKFVGGKDIRLTHYRTKSGNTVAIRSDITELVEARHKAQQNEAWLRALLEGAPIPLLISVDGVYRYANSFAHELLDVPEGELVGMETSRFYFNLGDRQALLNVLDQEGIVSGMKMDIRTLNGKRKTITSSNTRIVYRGEDAIFASVLDITEAENTRLALKRSEKQNRDLLELVPDALVVQANGRIVFVNNSAVRIFKADSKQAMIGTASIDIIQEDERSRIMELRHEVMEADNPTVVMTRHRRFDGNSFHSEMYSKSVMWNGILGTMNIIKDMSKRRSYEATLIQKEKEMSLAQEIGHFGHWRIRLEDLSAVWSEELYRIHGLDPLKDHIDMERAVRFVDRQDRQSLIDSVYRTADTQQPETFTVRIHLETGDIRTMSGTMRPEFDEDGNVVSVFGVSQDITERLVLEEKLRQSQKMEAIGQLTGGVAHDFNNLLAVIQGNTELLLDLTKDLSFREREQLNAIMRASHRGAMLTRSMLAFSRKQELRPAVTCLEIQVTNMIDMLTRTLGETIEVRSFSDPDLWPCIADPGQVESAILNLALNARDAMPDGGSLTIECSNTYLDEATVTPHEGLKAGNYVMLSVSDTGTGISDKDIEHVFEPFYTTKEVGKGTGLGLSMVYGFAKQSEGHITIQSNPGKGTTVHIYLPQSEGLVSQPPQEGREQSIDSCHILIVEDDTAMRELSVSLLQTMGATVWDAGKGSDALAILAENGDDIDLLLTDVMLPGGMNGPAIAEEALKLYPNLKVLYMSGYTRDALEGGAEEDIQLLQKPFKRSDLASKITLALQNEP